MNTSPRPSFIDQDSLWEQILRWDNLLLGYRKARRGKRDQDEIRRFGFNLEYELADLRAALMDRSYRPGSFRQFYVQDHRKLRLISAAPFRDRVAQHALMNVVEPRVDALFIADSYASRKGKGVHAAVRRYRQWAQQYPYALKLDIQRYFDSLDHRILKQKLRACVADPNVLWLFDTIIDSSPEPLRPSPVIHPDDDLVDLMERPIGLPLGNLTSQFFGNLYLNDLDHHVKATLGIAAYLRYVDDLVLLGDSKARLWAWCADIEAFLTRERIGIHPRKKLLVPVNEGLDVLGYRIYPHTTRLSRDSGYRFRRKLRAFATAYRQGRKTLPSVQQHVAGWLGHARQADSQGLCKSVVSSVCFTQGSSAGRSPGGSGRFVEQQPTEPPVGQP
jgi:hypothetical protein